MINIKFPDGSVKEFEIGITPFQIAQSISSRLADEVLVATVNSKVVDINSKINTDATIKSSYF